MVWIYLWVGLLSLIELCELVGIVVLVRKALEVKKRFGGML